LLDGLIIALLVVSHWFLDLFVHRHDLPLVHDAEEKLGFGLWNEPLPAVPPELGLFFAGFALFMNAARPRGTMGRVVPWFVLAV
jgi:hypothetical protein